MMEEHGTHPTGVGDGPARPQSRSAWSSLPKTPIVIIAIAILAAVAAPWIAPHDPQAADISNALQPPLGFTKEVGSGFSRETIRGDTEHVLGTDSIGRDVLSRLIHGTRYSLIVVAIAMLIGTTFGTVVGLVSGFVGGITDLILMRLTDVFFSFPVILLALLLAVVRGPSFANVVIAMAFVLWTRFARLIRAEALAMRSSEFVAQARVNGASPARIMFRHMLPNTVPTLTVLISLQLGWAILIEASLSFLGAGLPPTVPSWGVMIDGGQRVLREAWWVAAVPGFAIMLLVLAFNMLGDWLRDVLDPALSHQL